MNSEQTYSGPFVVTVASGKGGVGKSFLASNIAACLAKSGASVLIWDADANYPNQHLMLGVEPPIRLNDIISNDKHVLSAIYPISDNLYILADSPASGQIKEYDSSTILDIYRQLLVSSTFDFIIIDTPAITNEELLQCCNIADLILMLVSDEPTSLLDTYGLLKILLPYIGKDYINLLVNNVIDLEDADEMSKKLNLATKKFLDTELDFIGFVPYDRAVRMSILAQKLLFESDPESEVVSSIEKICKTLLNLISSKETV
jgi:flagellar biosynthesis protein FlhG